MVGNGVDLQWPPYTRVPWVITALMNLTVGPQCTPNIPKMNRMGTTNVNEPFRGRVCAAETPVGWWTQLPDIPGEQCTICRHTMHVLPAWIQPSQILQMERACLKKSDKFCCSLIFENCTTCCDTLFGTCVFYCLQSAPGSPIERDLAPKGLVDISS